MATVICTISASEMVHRCWGAAATLWENPEASIVLSPGIFRASGWTPQKVMEHVLHHLALEEHSRSSWIQEIQEDYEVEEWTCWITRRQDGFYVLKARRR